MSWLLKQSRLCLGSLAPGVLALLLTSLAGGLRAVEGPTALDTHLHKVVPVLINRGADLYNGGDPEACCQLYESSLLVLRPALADRPRLQQTVDKGLAEARKKTDVRERAFALRAVLDAIKSPRPDAAPPRTSSPKPDTPKTEAGFTLSEEEKALLDLTNAERKKAGVPELKPNEKLFQAARAHSANMARQERLSHILDDENPGDRLRKVGYRGATWGENCAAGQRTPEEAVSSWMNSEGHRQNLLNQQYTEVGLGIATSAGGTRYYTQVFGTPAGQ
jgi:uncharacterized protein YkwD